MENAAGSKRERDEDGREEMSAADDPLVQLAIDLINVESLSGYEQPMAVTLKHWLEQRKWIVELQEVAPQTSTVNGEVRHNLYARRPGIPATRTEGPRVLFNSHIDTVRARKCGGFMSLTPHTHVLMFYLSILWLQGGVPMCSVRLRGCSFCGEATVVLAGIGGFDVFDRTDYCTTVCAFFRSNGGDMIVRHVEPMRRRIFHYSNFIM